MEFAEIVSKIEKTLKEEYGDNFVGITTVTRADGSGHRFRTTYVVKAKIGKTEELMVEISRDMKVLKSADKTSITPLLDIQINKIDLRKL